MLSKYENIFGDLPLGRPPNKGVEHAIKLEIGTQIINMQPYRNPKRIQYEIEEAIKELLELDLLRPSSSPYASSVVMVNKKDGILRMCICFRSFNKNTLKNRYPIPRICEVMDDLHGSYFFSNIELRCGYHQIQMKEEDIPNIAFRCHYGHFEFVAMSF